METDKIILSDTAKIAYLKKLRGQVHKIIHIAEEQDKTGYSPKPYVDGKLFEVNSANDLFGGDLVDIVVKLNGIVQNCDTMSFVEIKKQVFEIKKIINYLIDGLEG